VAQEKGELMTTAFGKLAAWLALLPVRLAWKHPKGLAFVVLLLFFWAFVRG
jgi:hypothetical protein